MKKIIQLFISILIVSGCASHSEKNKNETNVSSKSKSEASPDLESTDLLNPAPVKEDLNEKRFSALSFAIQTKDDTAFEKASSALLSTNANDVKTLNAMAMYHAQKGRYPLAEMILNKVLKINENSYVAYGNLGWILFQKGKKTEGVNYFKKALSINHDYFFAAANLGSYFAEVKDYNNAKNFLEIVYKKGTKDLNLINNYAISLMGTGEKADEVFEQGMQVNSSNLNFLVNYCIYLVNIKKDYIKAKDIIGRVNFTGMNTDRKDTIKALEDKINANVNNGSKESLKR